MGREVSRFMSRELKKEIGFTKSNFQTDYRVLKSKVTNSNNIVNCNFVYDGVLYNLSPLLCIVKALKDAKDDYSYLNTLVVNEYKHSIKSDSNDIVNIFKIINFLNFDLGEYRSKESSEKDVFLFSTLLSSYRFYNTLDEQVIDFLDTFSVSYDYVYRELVGYFLLLDGRCNYDGANYEDKLLEDVLSAYVSLCNFVKAISLKNMKDCEYLKEFMSFTRVCLAYLIESNSESGATFDLNEKLSAISDNTKEWLGYFAIKHMETMSEEDKLSFFKYIGNNKSYVKSLVKSITVGALEGSVELKEKHKEEVKVLRGDYSKQVNALKKENKVYTKDLSVITKKYNKLEKYLEKVKTVDKEKEYKDKIAELELKNKQLASKLEGSNLRISTLNQKVSDLKEELENISKNELVDNRGNQLTDCVEDNGISLSDMVSNLSNLNILLIGGTDTAYRKLNTYLPNLRYIDASSGANFDVPLNTDYIVICTKILGHSHTRRAEVFENNVKGIVKTNKTNSIEIIKDLYDYIAV